MIIYPYNRRGNKMKRSALLCPSMMCCDFDRLKEEIIALDQAGCDIFHCDIMDGNYVDNMALSPYDVKIICNNTEKLVDVHLMVNNTDLVCGIYLKSDVDIIYIHPFTTRFPSKLLINIKEANKKAGIAINPHEPLSMFIELLPLCDYVMVMTVNPGFAGQNYINAVDHKIAELIKLKKKYNFKIILDGACSPTVIKNHANDGVNGFILGTATLFNKPLSYSDIIAELRNY